MANSSSRAGSTFDFTPVTVSAYCTLAPASDSTGYSAGKAMVNVLASPAARPVTSASNPGGLPSAPISMLTPWSSSGSTASSPSLASLRRVMSATTVSPCWAPRPSTGSKRARPERRRSIVDVTSSSGTLTGGLRSWIASSGPGSTGGAVAIAAVNFSGWCSSIETSFTLGVSTGSTPRSRSTSSTARGIRSSATSCRICGMKRWRTTLAGTFPGRKPGSFNVRA